MNGPVCRPPYDRYTRVRIYVGPDESYRDETHFWLDPPLTDKFLVERKLSGYIQTVRHGVVTFHRYFRLIYRLIRGQVLDTRVSGV